MSLEVTEELDLLEELGGPGFQTALLMINERLCLSIFMWWHTLYRAWQHGLAGPQAKQASALLSPTTQRDVKDHAGALLRDR